MSTVNENTDFLDGWRESNRKFAGDSEYDPTAVVIAQQIRQEEIRRKISELREQRRELLVEHSAFSHYLIYLNQSIEDLEHKIQLLKTTLACQTSTPSTTDETTSNESAEQLRLFTRDMRNKITILVTKRVKLSRQRDRLTTLMEKNASSRSEIDKQIINSNSLLVLSPTTTEPSEEDEPTK